LALVVLAVLLAAVRAQTDKTAYSRLSHLLVAVVAVHTHLHQQLVALVVAVVYLLA
jgi:hypothetical protein